MSYQKPPYQITTKILNLIQNVSQKIGYVKSLNLDAPSTELRRTNKIKAIHSSLAIEGNSLSLDQITSIINNKRVIGPKEHILEAKNAIAVYKLLNKLSPTKKGDLLKAHKLLMNGLISNPGKFRKGTVGIIKGNKIEHIAPPSKLVPTQISNLLKYLKDKEESTLIKSCVFHYEFEFIHPFSDGNGRMGRLWQTLILIQEFPIFEFIPVEQLIKSNQKEYYKALAQCDKKGKSTIFIEYMLKCIDESLEEVLNTKEIKDTFESRINKAKESFQSKEFVRLDYLKLHKRISTSKASRDLKKAVDQNLIKKKGDKRMTKYRFK